MRNSAIIVGSSGQVAHALRAGLTARGVAHVSTSSKGAGALDLGSEESVRAFFAQSGEGKEVFLPGAMTHVDNCELDRAACERVNAVGPRLVAEECAKRGHKLTYFSTEYVFGDAEYRGGGVGPFGEDDPTAPPCWYGACKLEGEHGVLRAVPDALVLRTTMVFSWAPEGQNFLMQYFRQLTAIAEGRAPAVFRVPEDQISTPTYAPALADACLRLRETGASGVYNVVGPDLLSRRELVLRVIEAFDFDREKSVAGFRFLKTSELGQRARRPLTAGLTTGKLEAAGIAPLALSEAFREIMQLRGSR